MKTFDECMNSFLKAHKNMIIFTAKEAKDSYLIGIRPKGTSMFECFDCSYWLVPKDTGKPIPVSRALNPDIFDKTENVKELVDIAKPLHYSG